MDTKRLNIRSLLHTPVNRNSRNATLFSPPPPPVFRQRTNSYEDLFTTKSKSDEIGSVTDIKTGWRSDSVLTEIGRQGKGWSKRSKLLIALGVFVVVIVALCVYLAIAIGKDGPGDSGADDETTTLSTADSTTRTEGPSQRSTVSTTPTRKPESTPSPPEWSSWDTWTSCSVTCDSGTQERNRTCIKVDPGDEDCTGNNTEQRGCTAAACPITEWAAWDPWTSCTVTCDSGIQARNRTCIKVDPGDEDCTGNNTEQRECTAAACPITEWAAWESWTSCSVTCDSGVQERNRTCIKVDPDDEDCEGENTQHKECTVDACPITEWSSWDSWAACSVTCGSGVQERNRTCIKVDPADDCEGNSTQQAECTLGTCPQTVAEWASWDTWSSCSVTCGSGIQERNRTCIKVDPADYCEGNSTQQAECTRDACPQTEWASWDTWSSCSVTCGSGIQERNRTCIKIDPADNCEGNSTQQAECTLDACPQTEWASWDTWSSCSVTCGAGIQERNRTCIKVDPADDCDGNGTQQAECTLEACPQTKWASWDTWSSCSVTCGAGVQERNRTCIKVDPADDCEGNRTQQAECTLEACPQTEWASWDTWSSCSVTCGAGVQERNRTCIRVDPADDCEGNSTQQAECTLEACPQTEWATWDTWSSCSVTCGAGVQERNRTCIKVDPADDCEGDSTQQAECTLDTCPQTEWASWDTWSSCYVTCGSGVQERNRNCIKVDPTDDCEGNSMQQAECTLDACPQTEWASWDTWSSCSVTCGSGIQERNRTCIKVDPTDNCEGDSTQQAECTLNACPQTEWASWDTWSSCSVTCGSGVQERNRTCIKVDPTDDCEGDNRQEVECTADPCPKSEWSSWGSWSSCSVTCGSGVNTRSRACDKVDPNDEDCEGENTQQSGCTLDPCPVTGWSTWGSWTQCTSTCGSGIHTRYRTCNNTLESGDECEGVQYVQQAVCTLDDCPVYGKWTTWSQWDDCGATCGSSVRSRSRQCNKDSNTDLDCMGDTEQQITCNDWDCPDCGKACSVGTLNEACDTCVCESSTIQGRILSSAGYPVSFADIATDTAPLTIIAQSNSTGFFILNNTCISSTVIVTREGFQDKVVQITSADQIIYLELEDLPRITEHPQSKYRITGEDVTFCCAAVAAPEITYYEWFHNSILLDRDIYTNNGQRLDITNVQQSDSGEYTCRANNEGQGIYSNVATLSIRDNADDFCEDALQQKQVKLPDSCLQPGGNTTLYEVGDCANKPCRRDSDNGGEKCSDISNSCCIPSQFETKSINCSDQVVELTVVKACSCGSCNTTWSDTVQVSGKVIVVKSGLPVQHAEVWLNEGFETNTSETGSFNISVANTIGRAVLNIKYTYNNTYLDTTKVVEIANGMGGNVYVTIQMLKISDPVTIDSATETVLSLNTSQNDSSTPAVLIKVPANSFYKRDGSPYTGNVSSFATFIDPSDDSIRDAIPGVFQATDEEGSNVKLESRGMFNLQFQTDAGEDLYVDGNIEVSFADQDAGNYTLWKLSTVSGLWEPLSTDVQQTSRKRRHAWHWRYWRYLIGRYRMENVNVKWINIDRPFRPRITWCYFKARVYRDSSLSEPLVNYLAFYRIRFRGTRSGMYSIDYGTTKSAWELSGFCLGVPCGDYIGYISLDSYYPYYPYYSYYPYYPYYSYFPYFPYYSYYMYSYYDRKVTAAQPKTLPTSLTTVILRNSNFIGVSMVGSNSGPFYWNLYSCMISNTWQSHFPFYVYTKPKPTPTQSTSTTSVPSKSVSPTSVASQSLIPLNGLKILSAFSCSPMLCVEPISPLNIKLPIFIGIATLVSIIIELSDICDISRNQL